MATSPYRLFPAPFYARVFNSGELTWVFLNTRINFHAYLAKFAVHVSRSEMLQVLHMHAVSTPCIKYQCKKCKKSSLATAAPNMPRILFLTSWKIKSPWSFWSFGVHRDINVDMISEWAVSIAILLLLSRSVWLMMNAACGSSMPMLYDNISQPRP